MATVSDIIIDFRFCTCNGDKTESTESFDAADSSLQSTIDDRHVELVDDLNVDHEGHWGTDCYSIDEYDTDWADPADFSDLDDYGEYAENVEKHGEAFHLRYEDLGSLDRSDFEDNYNGCWRDTEEFVENLWERTARDVMMDYSSYDGADGTHIFSNC